MTVSASQVRKSDGATAHQLVAANPEKINETVQEKAQRCSFIAPFQGQSNWVLLRGNLICAIKLQILDDRRTKMLNGVEATKIS